MDKIRSFSPSTEEHVTTSSTGYSAHLEYRVVKTSETYDVVLNIPKQRTNEAGCLEMAFYLFAIAKELQALNAKY